MLATSRAPNSTIDGMFPILRSQITLSEPGPKSEIHPGQADTWFTVFGPKLDDKQTADLNSGTLLAYVLNIMQYKDPVTPNRFIYTESCVYYMGAALHLCENGHNRSYLAD
ncbi:hypothetical protein SE92_21390 [Bradyrhizobium sp. AT1]|nr:hypothetical protein SE92_21390 [Bradyrhizobium sp. AT1]